MKTILKFKAARRPMTVQRAALIALTLLVLMAPVAAMASGAAGGQELDSFYTWFKAGVQGTWGKLLALMVFFFGMGATVLTQRPTGAVIGLVSAALLYFGPNVLESMFGAVLV